MNSSFTAAHWQKPSEGWAASGGTVRVAGIAKYDFRLLVISKAKDTTR